MAEVLSKSRTATLRFGDMEMKYAISALSKVNEASDNLAIANTIGLNPDESAFASAIEEDFGATLSTLSPKKPEQNKFFVGGQVFFKKDYTFNGQALRAGEGLFRKIATAHDNITIMQHIKLTDQEAIVVEDFSNCFSESLKD